MASNKKAFIDLLNRACQPLKKGLLVTELRRPDGRSGKKTRPHKTEDASGRPRDKSR